MAIFSFNFSDRFEIKFNPTYKEEDAKLAPFAVIFRKKNEQFFSFEYIRNKINEILDIELKPNFFSLSSQVESFDASFDILDSLYSYQIKANENAEKCFEILGKLLFNQRKILFQTILILKKIIRLLKTGP